MIKLAAFQASSGARMKLREAEQRTVEPGKSEPQNIECRISNVEGWYRYAQSFL